MTCHNPKCLGNYDFERIAHFAKKRFVDGCNTIALLEQAETEREKQEIALVSLLDLEDDLIRELNLCCQYEDQCRSSDCREMLKKLIGEELAGKGKAPPDPSNITIQ